MALAALAWETGAVVVAKGAQDVIVVAVAERFRTVSIATLDRHHFSVVCPAHAAAFTLLP